MYSLAIAYLLWFLSGFGALGFHRFYLGKIATGFLWMFTGGLFPFGLIYDFVTLPSQVREANYRRALRGEERRHRTLGRPDSQYNRNGENWRYASDTQYKVMNSKGKEKEKPERVILKLAKENDGILTISEVALGADITIEEAKKMLEALVSKGFAELRIRKSGSIVYVIPDLADKNEPLEDI